MNRLRRRMLQAGLSLPALAWWPWIARSQPTPSCGEATRRQTAGPFYTPNTPLKSDFRADDPAGRPVTLEAVVLDRDCRPLPGVAVDLWHTDSRGRYDNDGFRLRGHQRSGVDGAVRFDTIEPAHYSGRTRHYHLRLFGADGTRLLTTQLYFPGEAGNKDDFLFRQELLMDVSESGGVLQANFAFVV